MKTQLSFVSKEEAHKLIDESPGNNVLILTYNVETGMSDTGRHIKKKKSNWKRRVGICHVLTITLAPIVHVADSYLIGHKKKKSIKSSSRYFLWFVVKTWDKLTTAEIIHHVPLQCLKETAGNKLAVHFPFGQFFLGNRHVSMSYFEYPCWN